MGNWMVGDAVTEGKFRMGKTMSSALRVLIWRYFRDILLEISGRQLDIYIGLKFRSEH